MNGHIEEITYEYDSEGRISEKYISEDCPEGHSGFYSYEYNADGKLERIEYRQNEDDEGETVYECDYDEDGNLLVNPMVKNTEANGRFHTDWLNMMYPRLILARELLSDDGVIFISIDDNEHANLKIICDEINVFFNPYYQ